MVWNKLEHSPKLGADYYILHFPPPGKKRVPNWSLWFLGAVYWECWLNPFMGWPIRLPSLSGSQKRKRICSRSRLIGFSILGLTPIPNMHLLFLPAVPQPAPLTKGLERVWSINMGSHIKLYWTKRPIVIIWQRRWAVGTWPWYLWSHHMCHHPQAAGLTEHWNDLLKV